MPTTVQIREDTRRLLERLKKEMMASSYDEVIRKLARQRMSFPRSMYGMCRGSMPFEREAEEEHAV